MAYTNAYGINDAGDVIGTTASAFLIGSTFAFLWRNGSFTLLPTLGCSGGANIAYFIHNHGDVVAAGQMIPLPQPPLAVPQRTQAYGINDRGQIGGGGYVDATYIRKPLVWTVSGTPGGNRAPVAVLATQAQGFEGLPISFDGSASYDPDGDPLTYSWTFGDGGTGSGKSPAHTYVDNGTYTAKLTVADPAGLTSTAAATPTVYNSQPSINVKPLGQLNLPVGGSLSLTLSIADAGAKDNPWTWLVDWGDGARSQGQRATRGSFGVKHVYTRAGSFTVTASVTDKDGMTGQRGGPLVVVR